MVTRQLQNRVSEKNRGFLVYQYLKQEVITQIESDMLIGRDALCQLRLSDEFASQRHARIENRQGRFILRDLRSRNGTFVNGTKVMEAILQNHDRIQIGKTDFVFSCRFDKSPEEPLLQSRNLAWQNQLERLPAIAQSTFPILITGPTGTGKDVLAQTIHRLSRRRSGPFFSVNCSALGETLIASELFGHVRGSFTGAIDNRAGAFEAARHGTLFLDEVGDLPLDLQGKLLRALENQEVRPVGSDKTIKTDVRIVAATHLNLIERIESGKFRMDLYYRLNVIPITSPSLRERMEDFDIFVHRFAKEAEVVFTPEALEGLRKFPWTGNLRELKNVVFRARALYSEGPIQAFQVRSLVDDLPVGPVVLPRAKPSSQVKTLQQLELEMIHLRLMANFGNQAKTAADLGMPKSTLNDRIKLHNINPKLYRAGRQKPRSNPEPKTAQKPSSESSFKALE